MVLKYFSELADVTMARKDDKSQAHNVVFPPASNFFSSRLKGIKNNP